MSFIRRHKVEICIFVLALVARLLYLYLSYTAAHGDLISILNRGDDYFDIAANLIGGNGYSIAHQVPYIPTSYRTPGMPYFIAGTYLLFGSFWAVVILQIFLGSIVPLLGMQLARYMTHVRAVSVAVGIFLAIEPTSILFSTVLLSETVFTFIFLLTLLCLFRYWKTHTLWPLLLSAFLLGLSTLVRPTVEYLPIIIILLMLWEARDHLSRKVFMHAGVFVLVFLTVLSPWLYRNYRTFGVVGLSSQQGAALYAIMVPSVLAVEHKTSFAQEYNTQIAGPNDTNFVQSAEYTKLAMPILLSHPRGLALVSLNTMFSFFTYDGTYDVLHQIGQDGDMYAVLSHAKLASGIQPSTPTLLLLSRPIVLAHFLLALILTPIVFILLGRVLWLLITAGFFVGAWQYMRQQQQNIFALAAVVVVLYLMLTTILTGFTVNYRYRMPVNALIITFAMYEIMILAPRVRRKFSNKT